MRALLLLLLLSCLAGPAGENSPAAPATCLTPGLPHTAGSWTMVVLPDIQSYSDHLANAPILNQMTAWIAANKEQLDIRLALQEGDIVYQNNVATASRSSGDQDSAQQWCNARTAFQTLDGVIPYIVVPGNHDFGITNADSRDTQFNAYFTPLDNPLTDFTQGGILSEMGPNAVGERTLENAAYAYTAPDGRKLLILALEFGPRQAAVDWANSVASQPEYGDYTKVLLTHAYLYEDGTRYDWAAKGKLQSDSPHNYHGTNADTNDGEELWNELVRKYSGFELVLCGHVGGDMVDYLVSQNDAGQDVHQLVFNAQFLPQGGQGWLRLLEFLPDGKTVRVRTFSPYFALDGDPSTAEWRTGPEDDFSFELIPVKP